MVVYEMLRWHSPPALILLALLVSWNTQIPHTQEPKLTLTKLIHMLSNEENHKKGMVIVFRRGMYAYKFIYIYIYTYIMPFSCVIHGLLDPLLAKDRDFVEVFAGHAEISKAMRAAS